MKLLDPKVATVRCSNPSCGKLKGAGNHWYELRKLDNPQPVTTVAIRTMIWDNSAADGVYLACGDRCRDAIVNALLKER